MLGTHTINIAIFDSMRVQYLIILSLLFFACGGSEAEESDQSTENEQTETEIDSTLIDVGTDEESEVEVFLEDMPSNWIMLTDIGESEEELVIYNYCEAETQGFQLEPGKGDYWTMWIAYGQDGEECEIEIFDVWDWHAMDAPAWRG